MYLPEALANVTEILDLLHALGYLWQAAHVTHHKLKGQRRESLESICRYFHNNAHRMAYDVYLEHRFPSVKAG